MAVVLQPWQILVAAMAGRKHLPIVELKPAAQLSVFESGSSAPREFMRLQRCGVMFYGSS